MIGFLQMNDAGGVYAHAVKLLNVEDADESMAFCGYARRLRVVFFVPYKNIDCPLCRKRIEQEFVP